MRAQCLYIVQFKLIIDNRMPMKLIRNENKGKEKNLADFFACDLFSNNINSKCINYSKHS